ncbi:MAG: type I methionyl aminopeptidase [Planctomycetota bacterium]
MSRLTHGRGIILKSRREIELMRRAGRVVYGVLRRMEELAAPGVTTAALNAAAEEMIAQEGGIALFKGVKNPQAKFPFPAALCTSVNEELVHGIPGDRVLREGDIVSVDCGVRLGGYCGDSATTIAIGQVSPSTQHLIEVTRCTLELAMELIRPGRMWSEVASCMQAFVEGAKLSVVREFVGHGIGRDMHEEPKVPNFWNDSQKRMDFKLLPKMVLAVEPMVNLGGYAVDYAGDDRWVVVTKDRKNAAHFEHTLAVTEGGVDVLTDGR